MEVDVEAGLQFAVGLLQHRMSASNTPLSLRDSMETIGARLLSLHFPGLRSAKPFLHTGVDRLGRSFLNAADAVDDLIEAKERATDELVTSLGAEDKLEVIKFILVVEIILFLLNTSQVTSVQDRIRCVQTTRRVLNVTLKRLNETKEMVQFLMEKLCRYEGIKSEVWLKEGLELPDDEVDLEMERHKMAFVREVYIVNEQVSAFLLQWVTKYVTQSPPLVAEVVGPIKAEAEVKVNVTKMAIDDVMRKLWRVTKDEEIMSMMGIQPEEEEEESLEMEA